MVKSITSIDSELSKSHSDEIQQLQEKNQEIKEAYQNSTVCKILDRLGTAEKRTEIRKASWKNTYQDSTIIIGTILAFIAAGLSLGRSLTTEDQIEAQLGLIIPELLILTFSLSLQAYSNHSDFKAIENLHAKAKKYLDNHKNDLNQVDKQRAENSYNGTNGLAKGIRVSPWAGFGTGIVSGMISATTYFFLKEKTVSLIAGTFGPVISSTINTFVSKRLSEEALVLQEILKETDSQVEQVNIHQLRP